MYSLFLRAFMPFSERGGRDTDVDSTVSKLEILYLLMSHEQLLVMAQVECLVRC